MLRIQSTRLGQQLQPFWRQSLFAIRHESTASTPSTNSEPVKEKKERSSLSQRLGGSGRGKLMESSEQGKDAFASFLVQAQKKKQQRPRNNNNNNRQREAKPGQFDDAAEGKTASGGKRPDSKQQRKPKQQQQQQQQQQQASGKNNNRRQGGQQRDRKPRQETKKSTSYGSTSTSGPTRRATTFIDKDIDWASLSPVESVIPEVSDATTVAGDDGAVDKEQQQQQLEKELNTGDYTRFLSMGESIQWPGTLDRQGLESLVGGNASYGLDEKMAFLATVAKASSVGGTATVKK